MKQYIEKKIVNSELNDVERSEIKHSLKDISGWDGSFIKEPGLSMGQMIEFLVGKKGRKLKTTIQEEERWDESPEWEINIEYIDAECFVGYRVQLNKHGREICKACKRDKYKEVLIHGRSWDSLCDALWEAVKYKINDK